MENDDVKTLSQLLEYLNSCYPQSSDPIRYDERLKAMKEMRSVLDMVKECDTIKDGIHYAPYRLWDKEELLWSYLNQCIEECYQNRNKRSLAAFCDAYINVRKAPNADEVKQHLKAVAMSRGLEVADISQKIDEAYENFLKCKAEIEKYPSGSNGYHQILPRLKEAAEFLLKKHHVVYVSFGSYGTLESEVFGEYWKKEKRREDVIDFLRNCVVLVILILFFWGLFNYPLAALGIAALLVMSVFILYRVNKGRIGV
jgi:hypothetical protein